MIIVYIYFFSFCISNRLTPGEDDFSFAYDGRGKKVSGGKDEVFGELFSEGDIIGCYAVSSSSILPLF